MNKINKIKNSMPQYLRLEQRLMFDGAAVDTTIDIIAEQVEQVSTEQSDTDMFGTAVAYGQSQSAVEQAQQQIVDYLANVDAAELFVLFGGGNDQASADWLATAGSLQQSILEGQFGVQIEFVSADILEGAKGAFAASGLNGEPVIYINRDWVLGGADVASLSRVLIEEFGHAIDAKLNPDGDSAGDEGERFAAVVVDGITVNEAAAIKTADDHTTLQIDGEAVEVELASFTFLNAYEVNTDTTPAGKESNTHDFDYTNSLGQVLVDDDADSFLFSGNDVSAIGINIGGETFYGWISRPIKSQGDVRAFYFWTDADFTSLATAQADGNQDGDSDVTDNRGFILVVDQAHFDNLSFIDGSTSLKNIGSSSDRVDASINSVLLASLAAPIANPDTNTIAEDSGNALGNVLDNDTDENGDSLTVTEFVINGQTYAAGSTATLTDIGDLTINADGSYIFTPVASYSGSVPVATYVVSDGSSTASSTLTITVTPTNDAPVGGKLPDGSDDPDYDAADERYEITTPEDTAYDGQVQAFDSDGDSLTYSKLTDPTNGTVTVNTNGTYTYTPNNDYVGTDIFTVTVDDGNGGTTTITVFITVTPVNDTPVLTADNDATGAFLAIESSGDSNGTAGQNATGNVLTNDNGGDAGDTLTVTNVGTGVATQSVTASTTSADGTVVIGQYGTLTLGADGSYVYVIDNNNPDVEALRITGQTLTETFAYQASDDGGSTATTTLTVTIDGRNDNPVASDDYDTAKESTTAGVSGFDVTGFNATGNVLNNDTDVDGTTNGETEMIAGLTATAEAGTFVNNATEAQLTFTAGTTLSPITAGSFTYFFNTNSGAYEALYAADGTTHITVVSKSVITVNGVDVYTFVLSDEPSFYYTDGGNVALAGLSDLNGASIGFLASSSTQAGNSVKFATVDNNGAQATGTSTVAITSVTDGNIAVGMSVTGTGVPADTTVTEITYDGSGNITDITVDNDLSGTLGTLSFSAAAGTALTGQHGSLVLNADGSYVYTPITDNLNLNEGESAIESFQYTMTDTSGATSTATLFITVLGTGGSEPVATPDTNSVTEDAATPAAGNVLTDATADTYDLGEGVVINISSDSQNDAVLDGNGDFEVAGLYGVLKVKADGTYTYTLDDTNTTVNNLHDSETLTDTFQYQLQDPSGSTYAGIVASTLTITINGNNDAPVGGKLPDGSNDPTYDTIDNRYEITTPEDVPIDGQVKAYDEDDTNLSYTKDTDPTNGMVTVNSNGTYTYTPNSNYVGDDSFTVTVSDGNGGTTTITVFVTVTPVNDAPVLDLDSDNSSLATNADYQNSFTIGSGSTTVITDSDVSISDVDDTNIESASILLSNAKDGDLLSVGTLAGGLVATIDTSVSGEITVTLSGSATLAEYQTALQLISFSTTGSDTTTRTLNITVNDGDQDSNMATTSLTVNADDRSVSVTGTTVNEASPYAVFTVTGSAGQRISLALDTTNYTMTFGNAVLGLDTGNAGSGVPLQYFDGSNWVDYTSGNTVTFSGTTLLVRTAIRQDANFEGEERYQLVATNEAGTSASGEGGIIDDGTGVVFLANNNTSTASTSMEMGYPLLDDDRPLSVNTVEVNEGSPYAVFTVTGETGQLVKLNLQNDTATIEDGSAPVDTDGTEDYGPVLEYWDGSQWQSYTADSFVAISGGTTLLVRTAIINDTLFEGSESFILKASNTGGGSVDGYGFIIDDGGGSRYTGVITGGTPVTDNSNLDDDRALTVVSAGTVNEASTYSAFTVTGEAGYTIDLELGNTAVGTDADATIAGFSFEYSTDGGNTWTLYNWDGSTGNRPTFQAGGVVHVRVDIRSEADIPFEGAETFTLQATYESNSATSAIDTTSIIDDGSGNRYTGVITGGTPVTDNRNLDDDRVTEEVSEPVLPPPIITTAVTIVTPLPTLSIVEPIEFVEEPITEPLDDDVPDPIIGVLILQRNIPEQIFTSDDGKTAISLTIPTDTFGHTDERAQINLSAGMVDGTPLPNWLIFDEEKGEFRGIAPAGFEDVLIIRVIARDDNGQQVETIIRIQVRASTDKVTQIGKPRLTDQINAQSQFAWKADRDRLVQDVRALNRNEVKSIKDS